MRHKLFLFLPIFKQDSIFFRYFQYIYFFAHSYFAEFYELFTRANEQNGRFFYMTWLAREINHRFLVNERGDLNKLLHNFDVKIVLFDLGN